MGIEDITLKGGGRVDLCRASAIYSLFRRALPARPDVIAHVRAQAEGHAAGPPPRHPLSWVLWDEQGDLRPDARAVYIASIRDTPGGPAFDDPFAPADRDEAMRLVRYEDACERRFTGIVARVIGRSMVPADPADEPARGR
jgi:hypothetical protein